MNKISNIAVAAAFVCCTLAGGCLKGVEGDTRYVLKPLVSDGSQTEPADHYIEAFAYYVDTTRWTVASYDDAVAGRITDKQTGEVRTQPDAVAEPFENEALEGWFCVSMPFGRERMMVTVVDPVLRLYGYREQVREEGLTSIYESVTFYPHRNARHYKAGQWQMFNDFYNETPDDESGL